jgi:hypothetical protein
VIAGLLQIPLLQAINLLKPNACDAGFFNGRFHSGDDVKTSAAGFEMTAHEKIEYGLIGQEYHF